MFIMLYPTLSCCNLLHSTCFGGWTILYFPSLASESRSDVVVVQSKGRSSFSQTTAVCHLTGSVTRAHGLRFAVVCINAKLHIMFAKTDDVDHYLLYTKVHNNGLISKFPLCRPGLWPNIMVYMIHAYLTLPSGEKFLVLY